MDFTQRRFLVVRDIPQLDLDRGDTTICMGKLSTELERALEEGALVEYGPYETTGDLLARIKKYRRGHKKAMFFFPSFLDRPREVHEVFQSDGQWRMSGSMEPMRLAERVVTEDGTIIKDRFAKVSAEG